MFYTRFTTTEKCGFGCMWFLAVDIVKLLRIGTQCHTTTLLCLLWLLAGCSSHQTHVSYSPSGNETVRSATLTGIRDRMAFHRVGFGDKAQLLFYAIHRQPKPLHLIREVHVFFQK